MKKLFLIPILSLSIYFLIGQNTNSLNPTSERLVLDIASSEYQIQLFHQGKQNRFVKREWMQTGRDGLEIIGTLDYIMSTLNSNPANQSEFSRNERYRLQVTTSNGDSIVKENFPEIFATIRKADLQFQEAELGSE
jgi:hypothetical protein